MYRMAVACQNSSYNRPPHLGFYLSDFLGVDGTTYTTQTSNHAPEPTTAVKGVRDQASSIKGETTKKIIRNGMFIIVKDGKEYNALGLELRNRR